MKQIEHILSKQDDDVTLLIRGGKVDGTKRRRDCCLGCDPDYCGECYCAIQ